MKRYIFLLILLFLTSCATHRGHESSRKLVELKSISTYHDQATQDKKEVMGYIELNRFKPNRITVFNFCTYELFHIFRADDPKGGYRRLGTLKSSTVHPYGCTCTLSSFQDEQESAIASRYQIIPIVDGREQQPLKIQYVTDDQTLSLEIGGPTK